MLFSLFISYILFGHFDEYIMKNPPCQEFTTNQRITKHLNKTQEKTLPPAHDRTHCWYFLSVSILDPLIMLRTQIFIFWILFSPHLCLGRTKRIRCDPRYGSLCWFLPRRSITDITSCHFWSGSPTTAVYTKIGNRAHSMCNFREIYNIPVNH